MRSTPVPWWSCLAGLAVLPFLKGGRWTGLLLVLVLTRLAFGFEQSFERRLDGAVELRAQDVRIAAEPRVSDDRLRFDAQVLDGELTDWRLRLNWYRTDRRPREGECWRLDLKLREPRGSVNPGVFDYEAWLFRDQIAALGTVQAGEPCQPPLQDRDAVAVERSDFADISPRAKATLNALVFGRRDGLSSDDWDILRRTGTSHLFAISGLHLGLVGGFFYALGVGLWRVILLRWLPRSRDPAMWLSALAMVAYAAISGFGVPVQRALIMALIGFAAIVTGRGRDPVSVLGLACVGVLLWQPLVILSAGFWLSFVAAGVIALFIRQHPQLPIWRQWLGVQLALFVSLTPITLGFFGGMSVIALPLNLALVPLFALLLPSLMVAVALAKAGWMLPLQAIAQVLDGLWRVLQVSADLSMAYLQPPIPPWPALIAATVGVMMILAGQSRWRFLACGLMLPMFLPLAARPADGAFRVWFWDVGQGQSILVQTAGHDLLYDAGPRWGEFDAGASLVVPALKSTGVKQLNRLIVSHPDMDHAGGAAAVQAAYGVAAKPWPCQQGERWVWDGVNFEVLHPDDGPWSDNSGSCVLRIRAASGRSALLTGDIEDDAEASLLQNAGLGRVDLLSVPHHGSRSSSTPAFLARLQPELAVVNAGWRNRWGFPAADVAERYAGKRIELLNTASWGAVTVNVAERIEWSGARSRARLWRGPPPES